MNYLVLPHHHHLNPFAWRLHREGHPVERIPWSDRYEKAWQGLLDPSLRGQSKRTPAEMEMLTKMAKAGELVVLTDSHKWHKEFEGATHLFPSLRPVEPFPRSPVRLGAWWDGSQFLLPHLLIEDRGAWAGGMGPQVEGALTLVRMDWWPFMGWLAEPLQAVQEALGAAKFKGLVQLSVEVQNAAQGRLVGWEAGWHRLHPHALLAALGTEGNTLSELLEKGQGLFTHRFALVAPVSVPPWPLADRRVNVPAHDHPITMPNGDPLAPEVQRHLFWHDMCIDEGRVRVAGLDGLVAVAHAEADTLELARRRLHQTMALVTVPEKQWRPDAGERVAGVGAMLEEALGVSW